jgi:integrase/recombinase XerC
MDEAALAWLPRFFSYLTVRHMSPHTESNYRRDLQGFVAHCDKYGVADWQQVDHGHVRTFALAQHHHGANSRSIQRRLSALRSFYKFLLQQELEVDVPGEQRKRKIPVVTQNPALEVTVPKGKKNLPATIDADLMGRLLSFRTDDEISVRDKAIMELFYSSGLRLAELVGLDEGSIHMTDRIVRVRGKGGKERDIPVGRYAIDALNHWQLERTKLAKVGTPALFVGKRGDRISPRTVQKLVAEWAKRQGISIHVHPHMFRHSFAPHILESSQDVRAVQELLGHASMSTTQIYTHLDFQHLASIYDKAHPRARKKG